MDSVPFDPDVLEDLHLRAVRFRDAFMHFGEKAERDFDFGPAPAEPPGPVDVRRVVPRAHEDVGSGRIGDADAEVIDLEFFEDA